MGLPAWSGWLLSGLFAATLLVCLTRWRLMRSAELSAGCGHDDRWGAAAHAVMAAAMMVMLAPVPQLPAATWLVLFSLAAMTFAVRAARAGPPTDTGAAGRRSVRLQHLMASLGMLLMAAQPGGHASGGHSSGGHAHPGMTGTLTLTLASAFAVYFLLRAGWLVRDLVVAGATVQAAGPGGGIARFALRPRVVAGCELLMCAAMSYLMLAVAG